MLAYQELANEIKEAQNIVVLTGAGISTASGIPDFRSSQGAFWLTNSDRIKMMSSDFRDRNPKKFWPAFKGIFDVKINNKFDPNYGHLFLKELEDMGKNVTIITQNVDGLHQDAGSSLVYEMHGTMKQAVCPKCNSKYDLKYCVENEVPQCNHTIEKENVCNSYIVVNPFKHNGTVKCKDCDTVHPVEKGQTFIRCKGKKHTSKKCEAYLKPDVVLFGDPIRHYDEAQKAVKQSDLMIVIGSSLQVFPVAGLPLDAEKLAIINKDKTGFDEMASYVIHEDIVTSLKEIKKNLV